MKLIQIYDQGELVATMIEEDDTAERVAGELTGDMPDAEYIDIYVVAPASLDVVRGILGIEKEGSDI